MMQSVRARRWKRLAGMLAALTLAGCAPRPVVQSGPPRAVTLVLAATTDVHGWLRGWDYFAAAADSTRGLARAATIVDSLRAVHPGRVILVDAGDLLQGTPLTYLASRVPPTDTGTHPVVAAMNAMRYDAATIGNHEFNYGLPVLERAISRASFPFLAANAYRPDGRPAFGGWTIVERDGVKVAIVGATNPGSVVWDRKHLEGRLVVRDIVAEVRRAVAAARAAGADVVIASLHSGLDGPSSYDTATTGVPSENVADRVAREVAGIDVVVMGHSHREIADTVINDVLLVQPRNWATSVAVATLRVERDGGRWQVTSRRGAIARSAGHAEQASVVAATRHAHDATMLYVATPIGTTAQRWPADSARVVDTPLLDLVNEVQRRAANADVSAAAAFSLDAALDSGAITVAEVARLYPYENTLRAIRVTGRQLRQYLEHSARYYRDARSVAPRVPGYFFDVLSGVDYTLDLSRPIGQRVTRLEREGRAVADTATLTLALNSYRHDGGGGFSMIASAPVVYEGTTEIRDLLIEEVRRRGTLRHSDYFVQNWRLEPPGAVTTAYAATRGRTVRTDITDRAPRGDAPRVERASPPASRLRIIATNDFHGALEPRPDAAGVRRGGAAAMATMIRRARAECHPPECQTLLLDGGDMFQGTPASNLAFGRPVVELYHQLGYAAAALGNHELDWGQDTLRARMRQARHAILGANVRDSSGRDVRWIRDDTIVTRGPYRVGLIGIATVETRRISMPRNVAGLVFVDPAPIVDSLARRLRARGADAVVLLAHAGVLAHGSVLGQAGAFCDRPGHAECFGEIADLARRLTERLDAIISGHTHIAVDAVINDIPIVQARSSGRAIGVIDIPMGSARATDTRGREEWGHVREVIADSVPPDSAVAALVRRELARVAPLVNRRIATIREPMRREADEQYALGNLIADAQRWKGGGDVAVMNNGGIRADLAAGPVSYGALFEIHPFDNKLQRLQVRGAVLREYLDGIVRQPRPRTHVSGVTITFDPSRPVGQRIVRLLMHDGRPLDDNRTYRVILTDFLASGGDGLGFAGRALSQESLGVSDLQALIEYLRQLPQPVAAPHPPRLVPAQ